MDDRSSLRFLYVRVMLYRPLLSRFWSSVHHVTTRPLQSRSGASSPILRGGCSSLMQSSFTSECCKHCVTYSMKLISLTHESFLTQHTTSWWWNALCKCELYFSKAYSLTLKQTPSPAASCLSWPFLARQSASCSMPTPWSSRGNNARPS